MNFNSIFQPLGTKINGTLILAAWEKKVLLLAAKNYGKSVHRIWLSGTGQC